MKRHTTISILLFGGLILLSCRQSYQLILGETYFTSHVSAGDRQHSLIEGLAAQSQFSIRGVYWQKNFGKHELPVILRFDKATTGIGYAVLAESLTVEKQSWVRVNGTITTRSLSFGVAGASVTINVLEPNLTEKIRDIKPFVILAQGEYEKIRESIDASITPAESKLCLPAQPDWLALIDEESDQVIVSMRTNDLMYAAGVDFVLNLKKSKLLTVYANEWFKGE